MPTYVACKTTAVPKAAVRSFEDQLMTNFATNSYCKGATFARYYGTTVSPEVAAAMRKRHWTLIIDFQLGLSKEPWSLDVWDPHVHTEGEGDANKISADVCSIVLGHGGALVR
jgi:hypothetical protein